MKPRHCTPLKLTLLFSFCVFSVTPGATAQDRLSHLEWFIEGGGSFLNLGKQPNRVTTETTDTLSPPISGFLISPNRFTSSGFFFTGVRYHLTAMNALEVAYGSSGGNQFVLQPVLAGVSVYRSTIERHSWSVNYVRYLSERGSLHPFATAGLGLSQSISYITGWDHTNLCFNFGVGTDFRINERLAFRLEVRDYVGSLPGPLRGSSHDIAPSAGLVFSPQTSSSTPARYPQLEVFIEGGGSVLTSGGAGPYGQLIVISPTGPAQYYNTVSNNQFSQAGRLLAGFRVFFSKNNALELSYAQSPNRRVLEQSVPALSVRILIPEEVSMVVADRAANYVRYLPGWGNVKPFVTAGTGFTDFFGLPSDTSFEGGRYFGWNAGAGIDFPLWNRLVARFEFRDYMAGQPAPATGTVHNFAPTAGLAYRFK